MDAPKLANYGRDVANTYERWQRAMEKMLQEIQAAIREGATPAQIEVALLGRCNNREQMLNVLSTVSALVQMGKLDSAFEDIANKGVRPRRV